MTTSVPAIVNVRRLARAALLAAALAPAGCALHYELPEREIQAQLATRFPIEEGQGLWMVQVSQPRLRLGEGNRAGLTFQVAAGGVGVPTLAAVVEVEGTPAYRSAEGAFYLEGFTLRRLEIPGAPGAQDLPLRVLVEAAVGAVLRDHPVYVLDPKRSDKERLIKGHVRRIWVEPGRVVVEYHL